MASQGTPLGLIRTVPDVRSRPLAFPNDSDTSPAAAIRWFASQTSSRSASKVIAANPSGRGPRALDHRLHNGDERRHRLVVVGRRQLDDERVEPDTAVAQDRISDLLGRAGPDRDVVGDAFGGSPIRCEGLLPDPLGL